MSETLPSRGAIDDAEARHLLSLYERLASDSSLNPGDRRRLLAPLRSRLISAAEQAHRRAVAAQRHPKSVALPADRSHILAQQQPAAPAQPPPNAVATPNARQDYGDELARLIVSTIAPESWEQNGGNGSIYYFQPRQCLVVRQTDGVHVRLARLVADLRQP